MSPILIVLVALLLLVVAGSFIRRQAAAVRAQDAAIARGHRQRIFERTPDELGLSVPSGEPLAIVMDVAHPDAIASVVATATGDASLSFSTGAGLLGRNADENVRAAATAFVAEVRNHLPRFSPASELAHPGNGNVRFFVRIASEVRVAEASERALQDGSDSLAPLYAAGQGVIGQLRLTQGG